MNVTQKPRLHQDWIDPHAIGIVRALQRAGHTTYLVGGCVRDLLIGIHPKDFDIATTARPEEVKRLIARAYVIGKRFRLVLVRRDDTHFEVATFRREVSEEERQAMEAEAAAEAQADAAAEMDEENGTDTEEAAPPRRNRPPMPSDNAFGTAEEDARRRDFTINGLFYDPVADQLIDYAEGLPDLEQGWVRMIGDPMKRLAEDPIRILRALRLKHMIGFALDPDLRKAMVETAHTLPSTVLPRRREEILKLLRLKNPDLAFREAHDLGILKHLSPTLSDVVTGDSAEEFYLRLRQVAEKRGAENPLDLFGQLVHAYVRTVLQPDPAEGQRRGLLDDDRFQGWMRDELGMFKYEQALAVKALHVEPLLARRKEFQRRGERRQKALITNDAFPLALKFAETDHCLSCDDLHYWTVKYAHLRVENPMERVRQKRRRPRRRRGGGGGGGSRNAEARS